MNSLKKEVQNLREQLKERKIPTEDILQKNYINESIISRLNDEIKLLRSRENTISLENKNLKIEVGKLRKWKSDVNKEVFHCSCGLPIAR
ncbi:3103_t:CDS:2 [Gigaspora margarita]|uniref:3103_t:CDS:1 n=1 Tax=Gigaspora margarita TaxID=4874 RepID=A0ABM8W2F6_GIGMA|nr:3103_t:CDS:2 [Gigaspora margarita]